MLGFWGVEIVCSKHKKNSNHMTLDYVYFIQSSCLKCTEQQICAGSTSTYVVSVPCFGRSVYGPLHTNLNSNTLHPQRLPYQTLYILLFFLFKLGLENSSKTTSDGKLTSAMYVHYATKTE